MSERWQGKQTHRHLAPVISRYAISLQDHCEPGQEVAQHEDTLMQKVLDLNRRWGKCDHLLREEENEAQEKLSCPKQAAAAEAARAPGPTSSRLAGPRLLQGSSSEDAGFLSHVHTDRPLGRPRGPLLQQHVGLLVVQHRPGTALLDLVCRPSRQLLPQPLTI